MTAGKALVIACLIVAPGTVLRIVPHLDRLVDRGSGVGVAATAVPSVPSSLVGAPLPSRLSQRSAAALAVGLGIELAVQIGLLVLLLRSAAFASLWDGLPASLRAFAGLFFVLLMAGFIGGTSSTFPFVAWRMYAGDRGGEPAVYSLAATPHDGVTREIDIDGLIPVLGVHRLPQILGNQARWVDEPSDGVERRRRLDLQRRTLVALGRIYNMRNRDDALQQLSLYVARVPLDAGQPPWLRDRRLLCTVDADP